jgi:amino acid transporter
MKWGRQKKGYAHVDGVDGDVELEFAFSAERSSEASVGAGDAFMVSNLRMASMSSEKDADTGKPSVQSTKLGTFTGVLVPCLLNILGIILYLRLGWAIGQVGIVGITATFMLAGLTVTLTTLSISAIATNGVVKGGGAYFLISRTLGPELGGSVGLCLYLGNAIGVTFYLTGFSDALTQTAFDEEASYQLKLGISSAALLVLTCIAMMGAQVFSKLNVAVLASELVTVFAAMLSFALGSTVGAGDTEGYVGFGGFNPVTNSTRAPLDTFRDNLLPEYSEGMNFFTVFAVVFPAVTGIMAGANMSGDLKDPGKSLGRGTLTAIAQALSIYVILFLLMGATIERSTLKGNVHVMQDACFSPPLISFGILVSSASSGLGALCGASRILQALARDRLLNVLNVFAQGSKVGDEPQVAILGAPSVRPLYSISIHPLFEISIRCIYYPPIRCIFNIHPLCIQHHLLYLISIRCIFKQTSVVTSQYYFHPSYPPPPRARHRYVVHRPNVPFHWFPGYGRVHPDQFFPGDVLRH